MLRLTASLLGAAAVTGQLVTALETVDTQQKPVFGVDEQQEEGGHGGMRGVARANPLTRDFRRKVMHWLGEWHVPGLAVGVVDGEDTWTEVGWGPFYALWFRRLVVSFVSSRRPDEAVMGARSPSSGRIGRL